MSVYQWDCNSRLSAAVGIDCTLNLNSFSIARSNRKVTMQQILFIETNQSLQMLHCQFQNENWNLHHIVQIYPNANFSGMQICIMQIYPNWNYYNASFDSFYCLHWFWLKIQDSIARCSQETVQYSSKKNNLNFHGTFYELWQKQNTHLAQHTHFPPKSLTRLWSPKFPSKQQHIGNHQFQVQLL